MGHRGAILACGLFALAWPAADAFAQDDVSQALEARIRLANALYDQGNLVAALAEYRRIHTESGKAPALFNIGKICAALNRPVESVTELNKLLAAPGNTPPDRLAEAHRIRDEQQARIGRLQVKTRIPAVIEIDNLAVGETTVKVVADFASDTQVESLGAGSGTTYWLRQPIALGNGTHFLAALAPGHAPLRRQVDIVGGLAKDIELPLQPAKSELANIRVKANLPGADVVLDDMVVGRTPLPVSLPVETGAHTIALARPGYRTVSEQRDLLPGQSWDVEMSLEEDPSSLAGISGQLALEGGEPGASIAVDGKVRHAVDGVLQLPPGLHDLEITHSAFLPFRVPVDIESGRTRKLRVDMEATAEARQTKMQQVSGQRWRAWGTLAAGAIIAGGGALYLHFALADRDQANSDFAAMEDISRPGGGGRCDPKKNLSAQTLADCQADIDRVNDGVSTADRKVLGGYIATGVGAAVLVTGAILVLTMDDASRYEYHRDQGSSVAWLGWVAPSGGGVAWAGRF
jgi:hypothetical protein